MFMPLVIGWVVLATFVILVAVYRRAIARKEDDFLHVQDAEASAVSQQAEVAKKLESIDRWGKGLTVVALVYGLGLLGYYLYLGWQTSTTIQY